MTRTRDWEAGFFPGLVAIGGQDKRIMRMDQERKQDQAHDSNVDRGPQRSLPSRLIFGVSGSVSAYKAPLIVRELVPQGG